MDFGNEVYMDNLFDENRRLRAELEQADRDLEATQDANSRLESDNEAFHGFFEGEDGSGLPAHDIISNFCKYYVVVDIGRIEKAEARVRELERAVFNARDWIDTAVKDFTKIHFDLSDSWQRHGSRKCKDGLEALNVADNALANSEKED